MKCKHLLSLLILLCGALGWCLPLGAQDDFQDIAQRIASQRDALARTTVTPLLVSTMAPPQVEIKVATQLTEAIYLRPESAQLDLLLQEAPELLKLQLPTPDGLTLTLQLTRAKVLSPDFRVYAASDRSRPLSYRPGVQYWGTVVGAPRSLVALSITDGEVAGIIEVAHARYELGKVADAKADIHVLYRSKDLRQPPSFDCMADDIPQPIKPTEPAAGQQKSANNCVRLYVEVDYSIYENKGSLTATTNFVTAVLGQVSILFANDGVNVVLHELVVWDVPDPYTGPSSGNYLSQFREQLGGSFNGDLAHLLGFGGGGGVAYLNAICDGNYGVGYSGIGSTFANVPTYSWTINVITHEIGHNLGSPHTHACAWNGNNTAIDGCGPAAGYSEGCDAPVPVKGTIMSYCHLGNGNDFSLGFGPQPGDLIRSRVYNNPCLSACNTGVSLDAAITQIIAPADNVCTATVIPQVRLTNVGSLPLTQATITGTLDGSVAAMVNWTGNLANGASIIVNLPSVGYDVGTHTFAATVSNPNNGIDANAGNNTASATFNRTTAKTYYADNDGDGYGDPARPQTSCNAPAGYVANATDCNDNNSSAYPGAPCNDSNDCTTDDVLDNNCNCVPASGNYNDRDDDGVCDAVDRCPYGDDSVDANGNGVPDACDCVAGVAYFNQSVLTSQGIGSAATTYTFPNTSTYAAFTISNLSAVLTGSLRNRYDEEVTITYVDASGITRTYGTFRGSQVSGVAVFISQYVRSLTVTLRNTNGDTGAGTQLSVILGQINYCTPSDTGCTDSDNDGVCDENDQCPGQNDGLIGTACNDGDACTTGDMYTSDCDCVGTLADSDNDGVCDAEDICPGGDDTLDSDGDGTPDACDDGGGGDCPATQTYTFDSSVLTHQGPGSSTTTLNFASGTTEVTFTIGDLDARTRGRGTNLYNDEVTVAYVDAAGNYTLYGTYLGTNVSEVPVVIAGGVARVEVTLSDALGQGSASLGVTLSEVTVCAAAQIQGTPTISSPRVELFPNPTRADAFLRLAQTTAPVRVVVRNLLGAVLATYQGVDGPLLHLVPKQWGGVAGQVYLVTVYPTDSPPITQRLILVE